MTDESKEGPYSTLRTTRIGKPTVDETHPIKATYVGTEPKKAIKEVAKAVSSLGEQPKRPDHQSPQTPTQRPVTDAKVAEAETEGDPLIAMDRTQAITRQARENEYNAARETLKKQRTKAKKAIAQRSGRPRFSLLPERERPPQQPKQPAPREKRVTLRRLWRNFKTWVRGDHPKDRPPPPQTQPHRPTSPVT